MGCLSGTRLFTRSELEHANVVDNLGVASSRAFRRIGAFPYAPCVTPVAAKDTFDSWHMVCLRRIEFNRFGLAPQPNLRYTEDSNLRVFWSAAARKWAGLAYGNNGRISRHFGRRKVQPRWLVELRFRPQPTMRWDRSYSGDTVPKCSPRLCGFGVGIGAGKGSYPTTTDAQTPK